jgi:hypothetical protein
MAVRMIDPKGLGRLLDELDIRSRHKAGAEQDDYWVCQRRHPRYAFRADCVVRFMPAGSFTVAAMPGRTRNLSRNGLGLLVGRVFTSGDPIEVEVTLPGQGTLFLAGRVRFCRYAGRGFHELGVLLKASSPEPVFSQSPTLAMRTIDWLVSDS